MVLTQAQRAIATHRLLAPRDRVLVGVSGGADSVALLHVLVSLRPTLRLALRVVHLDHGLRAVSREDASFVEALALRWGLPATIERRDVGAICAREGWSLEDGARRVRYQCFLDVARRYSMGRIALAHTADDQAETVLLRLVRGTGLLGLGAIPTMRELEPGVCVVRPLLEVWRRDILAYLREAGLSYREDETNRDQRFLRNRIRGELLPLLERHYNPNIKRTLTQLAEQSRWDYAYLQAAACRLWKRAAKERSPSQNVAISVRAFRRQPKALQRQLVRRAVERVRGTVGQLEFRHWVEVEQLFLSRPAGTILDLPGNIQFRRGQDRVVCESLPTPRSPRPLDPLA
jgi:tRNA(Ile)-lysidine synthase